MKSRITLILRGDTFTEHVSETKCGIFDRLLQHEGETSTLNGLVDNSTD
jgi:hypothetical protein